MVQMPTFRKWRWNLHEESPECFMSTWGCRTSVLNILYPTVSMCTHRHTIRNFETLKNLCFSPSPVVGSGILHTHFCAFGCTYMCLLGVKTCFGPFWVFFKHWKYSNNEALRQTLFLVRSQKHHFFDHFTPESGPKTTLWSPLTELSGYLWTTKCAPKWSKRASGVRESPNECPK